MVAITLETTAKLAAQNPWVMIGGLCMTGAIIVLIAAIGWALSERWPDLSDGWGQAICMTVVFGLLGGTVLTWAWLS